MLGNVYKSNLPESNLTRVVFFMSLGHQFSIARYKFEIQIDNLPVEIGTLK